MMPRLPDWRTTVALLALALLLACLILATETHPR